MITPVLWFVIAFRSSCRYIGAMNLERLPKDTTQGMLRLAPKPASPSSKYTKALKSDGHGELLLSD